MNIYVRIMYALTPYTYTYVRTYTMNMYVRTYTMNIYVRIVYAFTP